MKFLQKLIIWLIGKGYEVGERVYWDNPYYPQFAGEYVVTSKRNKLGYVGIYNEEMRHRTARWYQLSPLDDKEDI